MQLYELIRIRMPLKKSQTEEKNTCKVNFTSPLTKRVDNGNEY